MNDNLCLPSLSVLLNCSAIRYHLEDMWNNDKGCDRIYWEDAVDVLVDDFYWKLGLNQYGDGELPDMSIVRDEYAAMVTELHDQFRC